MPAAAATGFDTPFGRFELHRYPARRREPLQAWSAADQLLLSAAHDRGLSEDDLLVVGDSHGALTIPLRPRALWTDSALALTALRNNEVRNDVPTTPVIWSTESPAVPVQCVVLRVPRQLPYFEYQLAILADLLPEGAVVLAAGMDKHLSPRTAALLEHWIGPTERHRGQRKARLFSATRDASSAGSVPQAPGYYCPHLEAQLAALPGVFSPDRLDIGSRFLLDHLDRLPRGEAALDMACGNGVLGLAAFRQGRAGRLTFCDESALAIAAARMNAQALFPDADCQYHHGDGGAANPALAGSDLVLLNPPFHLEAAVDEFAGRRLINQAARVLAPGGALCLVANRHLNYLPLLRRLLPAVEEVSSNRKFRLLLARRE